MPSWNIHIAHAEQLLATEGAAALGIRDANAFLFGNLVPDIYVGYMVDNPTRKIEYRDTHFADPGYVPEPRYGEFWERFAAPSADSCGRVSDVVLGAWTHLVADNVYNRAFNQLIAERGVEPGERTRIRKQTDFDLYGRTRTITAAPEATAGVIAQAWSFPQYAIAAADVCAACAVAARIVADNATRHVDDPSFDLLTGGYFDHVPGEVDRLMRAGLHAYAAGDPRWGAADVGDAAG